MSRYVQHKSKMADDLQDEWWLQDDDDDSASKKVEPPQTNENNRKPAKAKLKKTTPKTATKPRPAQDTVKRRHEDVPDPSVSNKKKRRRNKKKISEQLTSEPTTPSPADVMSILLRGQKMELTAVEMEELTLEDNHFLSPNDLSHTSISSYLKEVVPDWLSLVDPHEAKGAPLVLVLAGAAKRAVDLNRDSATFRGKARSIKLFAKHIKVQDQVEQLSKQVAHLAVGTPARVATLVEEDALRLDHVRCVVLDWTYRDVKLRRLCDIPEVRDDLFQLLRKHLIPLAKDGILKFGLF
ncbi:protein CMSS1-like [Branchiostoma floridae]|uniref:Protein CMSS1-like n=1 Tax=Branchiostoma floridae TaxID=7739 RepID=A0A9J7LUR7_BRAFL|nr:protein CMSS1-like [Branchiostoma floridae]